MKEKFMSAKNMDDLYNIEDEVMKEFRNDFYNKWLEDKEIVKHLCKILKLSNENMLQNVFMINGAPPLDDFDELEDDEM